MKLDRKLNIFRYSMDKLSNVSKLLNPDIPVTKKLKIKVLIL